MLVDPVALRPAGVPDAETRPQLRLHDRPGDGGGAGLGEQAARLSRQRRFDPDLRQPGGSRLDGRARRAAGSRRWPRTRSRSSRSNCWPRRRPANFMRRSRQASPLECVAHAVAPGRPAPRRGPLFPSGHCSGDKAGQPRRGHRGDRRSGLAGPRKRGAMIAERPDWLIVERRDGAADRQHSARRRRPRRTSSRISSIRGWRGRTRIGGSPELYDFVAPLGATIVRTLLSRSVIDVNRDPSGASLYPGQATTELCPTTTFDGEPLYRAGQAPDARMKSATGGGVISTPITPRSRPRSPACGRNSAGWRSTTPIRSARASRGCSMASCRSSTSEQILAASCSRAVARERSATCSPRAARARSIDGRFKGGWITRAYGDPDAGVEAMQMELACRAYMREPERPQRRTGRPRSTPRERRRPRPLRRVMEVMLEHARA